MSYTYGQLNQKNEAYLAEEWAQLDDLYIGGFRMRKAARKYLPKMVGEPHERYIERLNFASYINYLGQMVDQFTANVFSQELTVTPAVDAEDDATYGEDPKQPDFYKEFQKDADLNGTSLDKILRSVFSETLVKRRSILTVDFPSREGDEDVEDSSAIEPSNLLDEESLGLDRAYVFQLPIEMLFDWRQEGPNHLEWAVLCKTVHERKTPGGTKDLCYEEFKVWEMDEDAGVAVWSIYRTAPHHPDKAPKEDEQLKLIANGRTTFKAIPLLIMDIPEGLWIGNRVGPLALEHFQRRSALISAQNRSLFAVPIVKLGAEDYGPGAGLPAEVQQDEGRAEPGPQAAFVRKGFMVLGSDDDVTFAEPSGHVYTIVDQQLDSLVNEMFRTMHHMASSVASTNHAQYRSGKSKVEDRHAMEIILSAFGSIVRSFAKNVFDFVSMARGEKIVWAPHGMDTYELEDRELLIKEGAFVDAFNIPSKTFKKAHKTKLAFALVGNVPTATKQTIREEISQGVDEDLLHEEKQEKLEEQLMKADMETAKLTQKQNKALQDVPGLGTVQGLHGGEAGGGGSMSSASLHPADAVTHHPFKSRKGGGNPGAPKPPKPSMGK